MLVTWPMIRGTFLSLIVMGAAATVIYFGLPELTPWLLLDPFTAGVLALGLAWGGAAGNLLDRVRWGRQGVVDFIDIGVGDELRLGDTPIGTFSVSLDLRAAALVDIVKERAQYERADFATAAKRARTEYKPVGELQAGLHFWWYPVEGIQVRVGYDAMGFFNTISSPYPVDFDFRRLNPGWTDGTWRFLDGIDAGIGFIF